MFSCGSYYVNTLPHSQTVMESDNSILQVQEEESREHLLFYDYYCLFLTTTTTTTNDNLLRNEVRITQ